MLTAYLKQTGRLLQNPQASPSLYATSDLTDFINIARGQVAGEAECIRAQSSLVLGIGSNVYSFSSLTFASPSVVSGIQGALNLRQALLAQGTGQVWLRPRNFEWFTLYVLNNPSPAQNIPTDWSQFGQGVNGTVYFGPTPNGSYGVQFDTVCYPIPLVDDSTVEAIPYLWTDAVPFFAAYYALLSAQSAARQADADRMFARYTQFMQRARQASTPSVLPTQNPQQPSPVRENQLGMTGGGAG